MSFQHMSTEQKIQAWADWSRRQNPLRALDYKSPAQALIEQHMGGGVPLPNMSDDEALRIDMAVLRLKARQPDLHKAFVMYYLHGKSQNAIARAIDGLDSRRVADWVQRAVFFIDGFLSGIDIAA